ncbi:MAG: DM13 domain-containing protein [Acidimicrobiales bacterium]
MISEESTDTPEPRASPAGSRARQAGTLAAVVVVVAAALFGANLFGARDSLLGSPTPAAVAPATGRHASVRVPAAAPPKTVLRSYPWWQAVTSLQGSSPTTSPSFAVDPNALQWRVKWTCQAGQLVVRDSGPHPVVDAACPGSGTGYETQTGATTLGVTASGPWQVQVDQQVDVPLVEPPTPAMAAPTTTTLATASLYDVDQSGSGQATIYRLADGSFALRLDSFFVTPNVDLEIRLSPLPDPHSTSEYQKAPSVLVAPLDVTTGSIDFAVPAGVDPTQYHSLVIWCPLIQSAYAAASLSFAP